jgi:hypothetical protein
MHRDKDQKPENPFLIKEELTVSLHLAKTKARKEFDGDTIYTT